MMGDTPSEKPTIRFLSFANNKEDAEKEATLKEAAAKIEQAMAKKRALDELVDYKEDQATEQQIDPAHDTRSLYDRLQEQKNKKKESHEESQKLSNWIAKLDDDDIEYLNAVAKKKQDEELRKRLEIQDAYEAKKRLDEQKMLNEEMRMRESLLGKSPHTNKTPTNKSRISSLMKIKSKLKGKTDQVVKSESDNRKDNLNDMQSPASSSVGSASDPPQSASDNNSDKRATGSPVDSPDKTKTSENNSGEKSSQEMMTGCSCPKDLMTSIGVLPSLPIVRNPPDESDKDSDCSDDDLYGRLVPRSHRRKKRKRPK